MLKVTYVFNLELNFVKKSSDVIFEEEVCM
jgi:hypothetical protein